MAALTVMLRAFANAVASRPRLYEIIQNLLGRRSAWREIATFLPETATAWLDIGSSSASYPYAQNARLSILIDVDLLPLALAKKRNGAARAVVADAAALPFRDRSIDLTTCFAVSHHLDDAILGSAFREIARVTTRDFIFFDALRVDSRALSRLLWQYDRGSHPRTRSQLERALAERFRIVDQKQFRILHEYWLVAARPAR